MNRKPFSLGSGEFVPGEYVLYPPTGGDIFSGLWYIDLIEPDGVRHFQALTVVTDSAEQVQKICDLLNSHDITV